MVTAAGGGGGKKFFLGGRTQGGVWGENFWFGFPGG